MSQVLIPSPLLVAGLQQTFADTYSVIRNRQADSRLGKVMDLSLSTQTRTTQFGYFEAAPHMEYWPRGSAVPSDAMGGVAFSTPIFEWARRVKWSKFDRKDEQTQSLFEMAQRAGESNALLPERFFFDLLQGTTTTLPAVPLAPDGAALFATTAGGANRFGVSNGNLLTGTGVATTATILADYYNAIEQFMLFQDGKGQPMLSPETVAQGTIIVMGAGNLQAFETAFLQQRQGVLGSASGTPSNIVLDASRNIELWATPRIGDNDWYVFLKNPPKQATFFLDREGYKEFEALEGGNNSDHVRNTGEEYVQWESRSGAGIALPYGAIKINN